MSLISEALKEAQRERTGRGEPKGPSVLGDSFFPYPESGVHRHVRSPLLYAAVVVVLVAGGVLFAQLRARRAAAPIPMSSISNQVLLTSPVAAPSNKPAASRAADSAAPTVGRATPAGVVTAPSPASSSPAQSRIASQPAPSVGAEQKHVPPTGGPATREQAPKADAAVVPENPAAAPASAARPADAPAQSSVQQQSSQPRVRVSVDAMGSADSLFRRAYAEQMRGNVDGAADLYEKAINTGKASADLYNNYGALLARKGNNAAAVEIYALALKRDDRNVNAWVNLAAANDALGRHAEAMSDYAQAAKLDPANGIVKARLAKEYLAIGDTASARRNFDDALKTSPSEPDVHYGYGLFLEAMHDRAGAIREFQQFIDLAPSKYDAATVAQVKEYVLTLRSRPND